MTARRRCVGNEGGLDKLREFMVSRASSSVISERIVSISLACSSIIADCSTIRIACSSTSVRKVINSMSSASGEGSLALFGAHLQVITQRYARNISKKCTLGGSQMIT